MVNLLPLLLAALASAKPTVYLIRHGEKPESGNGLNAQGVQRAQCLRSVFGAGSGYGIGHVMAMTPKESEFILSFSSVGLSCVWICAGSILDLC